MQYSHQQPWCLPTIPFFWRLMLANPKFSLNLISPSSMPHSKQWWKPWTPRGRRQASLSVIPTHQPYSEETAIELIYLHINDSLSLYFLLYLTPLFSTGSQGRHRVWIRTTHSYTFCWCPQRGDAIPSQRGHPVPTRGSLSRTLLAAASLSHRTCIWWSGQNLTGD